MLERLKCQIRARAGDRGVGVLEFALVLPVFLMLVFGLVDLGRATMLYNSVATAAQEGARFGMVLRDASWGANSFDANGNDKGTYAAPISTYLVGYENTIVGQVARRSGALDLNLTTVEIDWPDSTPYPGPGTPLTVTVSHSFAPVAGSFLRLSPFTVSASSTMIVE